MKRDEVLSILASHQKELKQMGVKTLDLFGSVARDETGSESDVDFIVEFAKPVGLFQFIQLRLYLVAAIAALVAWIALPSDKWLSASGIN